MVLRDAVQAKPLSKDDFKMTATSFFEICFNTGGVGISECERVSCGAIQWVHTGAGESIRDDSTVIDIECDCMVRCILISEVHLTELCRRNLKGTTPP